MGALTKLAKLAAFTPKFAKKMAAKMLPKRMAIHARDVVVITGLSDRSARRLIQQIKTAYGKEDHTFVTITEFCNFGGFPEDEVRGLIE